MALILAFGVVLLISVSLSGVAARTILSTASLFLLAGALIGQGGLGLVEIGPRDPLVTVLADLALFTVLFTDGQRARLPALRDGWRLSGRALGLGMPLTMIGVALPAHFLVGLDWPTALLVGAILSPTDPVFAAAIVGRHDVPLRLRRLLNVESGLNDGLALPFVLIFLATAAHTESDLGTVAIELVLGAGPGYRGAGAGVPGVAAEGAHGRAAAAGSGAARDRRDALRGLSPHTREPVLGRVRRGVDAGDLRQGRRRALRAAGRPAFRDHEVRRSAGVRRADHSGSAVAPQRRRVGRHGPGDRAGPPGRGAAVAAAHADVRTGTLDRGVVRAEGVRVGGLRAAGPAVRDSGQ
jgi:hypothetical protein